MCAEIPTGIHLLRIIPRQSFKARFPRKSYNRFVGSALLRIVLGYLFLVNVGLILALMTGLIGAMGTFTAGKLADVLSRRDERWRAWVVAAGKGGYVPFLAGVFIVDDLQTALILYIVPAFFGGFYLAPTFALIQSLVSLRMRALASSITLFILNIIGMGFGPQLVGIMSDWFAPEYGQHSLRMALLVLSFLNLWCAYHYFTAARTLRADIKNNLATAERSAA